MCAIRIWKWQIDIMKYQFAYIEQCRQQTVNFRITPQQRNEVCFPYTPLHSIDVVYDKQATASFILHTPVSSSTDECVHKMADGELVCTLMRQSSQTRACSCEKDVRRPGVDEKNWAGQGGVTTYMRESVSMPGVC